MEDNQVDTNKYANGDGGNVEMEFEECLMGRLNGEDSEDAL